MAWRPFDAIVKSGIDAGYSFYYEELHLILFTFSNIKLNIVANLFTKTARSSVAML